MTLPDKGGRTVGPLETVALILALAIALPVASFAIDSTLIQPFVIGIPLMSGDLSPLWFGLGLVGVVLVHIAAWIRFTRSRHGRVAVGWMIGVSVASVLFFAWVALLGLGFYSAGQGGIGAGEAVSVGSGMLLAFAGPSIASLISAVTLARRRRGAEAEAENH